MSADATCTCPRWRRWTITHRFATFLYASGITSNGGSVSWGGEGHNACHTLPRLDLHARPYILGVSRDTWRCWLIGHHRRGEEVGFGLCGKCMPWPCCGATTYDHAPSCEEALW